MNTLQSSEDIFKTLDGRIGAKRPRERSTSPDFSSSPNPTSVRGTESEVPLLSFSDLIRPLSATPSPEPSPPSGTSSHSKDKDTVGLSSEPFDGMYTDERMSTGEESDELMDDAKVAEVRRMVIAWGILSPESGPENSHSNRERQLAMMVMALTHPARPTASQIAAQAEHIRTLLAERTDLNDFRHADRLSFERTAQALSARASVCTYLFSLLFLAHVELILFSSHGSPLQQRVSKWTGGSTTSREAVHEDERSRTVEFQTLQDKLFSENSRLEHDLREARHEIAMLRQSIEDMRVSILIRQVPHTTPSSALTSQNESAIPPAPNPRGRPRKYPVPSPVGGSVPTHSTPGAQLPTSSSSILNTNTVGAPQPPPEKRMRGTQPDARAELLVAAARRVGRDRVLKLLEGSEVGSPAGKEEPKHLAGGVGPNLSQPKWDHSSLNTALPKVMFLVPSHLQTVDLTVPPHVVDDPRGLAYHFRLHITINSRISSLMSAQEADRNTLESSILSGIRDNTIPVSANPTPRRAQQVVVPFTGDPQIDAQACLASFVAHYPGIQPASVSNSTKQEAKSSLEDAFGSRLPQGNSSLSTNTIEQYPLSDATQTTPSRNPNDTRNHGLDHLLSAARTMLRTRSQSASPTPQRQLTSNSALASPHHISTRKRRSPSLSHSCRATPAPCRHSSSPVEPGDSDTEPEEPSSQGGRRVYSALDVLADQAAAARTSSPDPPIDRLVSPPERREHHIYSLTPFPVTPEPHAALFAPPALGSILSSPMTAIPTSDPPQLSSSSTSPSTLDTMDNIRRGTPEKQHSKRTGRIAPESSRSHTNLGPPSGGTASITNSVSHATTHWVTGHTEPSPMSDEKITHLGHLPFTPQG
ncbi:hypothetical protein RhiXN_04542 [Rhizoctonia solani]|uniref:Uncharacterized protein n=1 Tax=Rhizoctonia solani TaxID=456999 RepID=A0A8H8SS85_9AGAM|nr:uncharacterized protein RhiXN_04542 [Rhizoctonia solani]QRW16541.1 hypothetical protein RhiXN_04542 [Rhizoctonia solani]